MDIICTCCGEPYDIEYVLHEDPSAFKREGCLIRACPSCNGLVPAHLNRRARDQLRRWPMPQTSSVTTSTVLPASCRTCSLPADTQPGRCSRSGFSRGIHHE